MAEMWFRIVRWVTSLDAKKMVIFLCSLIISLVLYENYNLRHENERLDSRVITNDGRSDSIVAILKADLQECNDKRFQDLEKSNAYWSQKYEELEKQLHEDYKTVKQIRRRK